MIMVYTLSILLIIYGIFVIISKNPIVSIFFLIGLFLSVAIYLIITGTVFVGLSYLLVYIGAVSILFLFILMLIDIRISELITENNNSIFLSIIISTLFFLMVYNVITYINEYYTRNIFEFSYKLIFFNNWEISLLENSDIVAIGNVIYTSLYIWLIISLLILLLAMVGAIKINIK